MAETYTTIQGDTWDLIAFKVYGSESYASYLMENNYPNLDTLVFSSGIVLNTPALSEELEEETAPWKSDDDDDDEDPYDDYSDEEDED